MKEELRSYFSFSKSQSRGILILSFLTLLSVIFYFSLDYWYYPAQAKEISDQNVKEILASIYVDSTYQTANKPNKLTPFNFNPNTLSEDGFIKLGLKPRLAKTILNYRNKGGRFYKKEDFKKIWGLHEKEYAQLAPFISIPTNSTNQYGNKNYDKEKVADHNLNIEINTATAEQLIALNGIADKLASNILKYKKMLGGFYSVQQLKEVYGIRPETFEQIKKYLRCNPALIQKININAATLNELNAHPYLRNNDWALAITKFRKTQNYEIKALEDLKSIEGMTDVVYNKIVPYLSLQ